MQKTTRILIVDDDEDDFFITSDYIKEIEEGKFLIQWAQQYNAALQLMREHAFDIYFVDFRLGAKTGIDLLKEAIASKCEEPIILLTGKGNREVDRLAMKIGAFDYLVKSELNTEKLERTIRYALERSSYINAIRRNERKFRNIFEQSMDAVFIADMHLNFREMNPAAGDLLEAGDPSELLGKKLPDLLADSQEAYRILTSLQSGQDINDRELEVLTSGGNRKSCILSASVESDLEGQHYIQGILHDITNLKKTEWLTLQAEKLAATGRLVRTLAHEVRNPLNNITLSAEQLQLEYTDESNQLYLDVIRRNSLRISRIITELLNSSRQTEFELHVAAIQELLDLVLTEAADTMSLQQVKLDTQIPEGELMVLMDKEKLRIAFMNIIVNAIEAMQPGGGELIIRLSEKNGFAVTEINDNGTGIPAENMGRLFEPYYTSKRNGMGLGLASTLNIVQSHKGFIDVHSTEGRGTSFIVNLPLFQNNTDH
ncbi:hybrid sensor histidine kinase/response regulator [Flavihumibacter petaseus]|nr:ATP-binding protein [Flavihumibacter petaseus]